MVERYVAKHGDTNWVGVILVRVVVVGVVLKQEFDIKQDRMIKHLRNSITFGNQ